MSDVHDSQQDLVIARASLDALNEVLDPHYKSIRAAMVGHTALGPIGRLERRRESTRRDIQMLKNFGALLPNQEVNGRLVDYTNYKADSISTTVPDLYQAKIVQAFALYQRAPGPISSTIAYLVGTRPSGPRDTRLLLVAPAQHAVYSYTDVDGSLCYKEFNSGPRVLTITVPNDAFAAYWTHVQRELDRDFTEKQVWSMKVPGEDKYVLDQGDLTQLRRWGRKSSASEVIGRRGLVPSIPQGWLLSAIGLTFGVSMFSELRAVTYDDLIEGLNGWSVERWMPNLAIAFGKQDEYKRLLEARIITDDNPS